MAPVYALDMTPSSFSPGELVTIQDTNLGTTIPTDLTICFTLSACLTPSTTSSIIASWSNTSILLQPPLGIPEKGTLILTFGGRRIEHEYRFSPLTPVVYTAAPLSITPNSTPLTISGSNFGVFSPKSRICINTQCILDEYTQDYVTSWSDKSIQLQLPNIPGVTSFTLRIEQYVYTQLATSKDIYRTITIPNLSFIKSNDPNVIALSPQQVVLDDTIVRVTGEYLGDGYDPNYQSICFQSLCFTKEVLSSRVITWNNSEISFTIPRELAMFTTLDLSIYLYYPSSNSYKKVGIGPALTIVPTPIIAQYTPAVQTGDRILLNGSNFGTSTGTVSLGKKTLEVTSWTENAIEVYVGNTAVSGLLEVKNLQGSTSLPVYITVKQKTIYSKDSFSAEQWYIPFIGIQNNLSTTGEPITVAVIDSGVDFTNPELQGSSWSNLGEIPNNGIDDDKNGYIDDVFGWDFIAKTPMSVNNINHDHGTQIASIIRAKANNFIGFAGLHDTARIMSLKVAEDSIAGKDPLISFDAAQRAIKYAVDNGAQIINLSFSGATNSPLYSDVLKYAYSRNVLVLAASGNTSTNLDITPHSPICDDSSSNTVLGIGSLSAKGVQSAFSNYGTCIDLYAPGEEILATNSFINGHTYMYVSGTSFATPIVAAVAAKLWSIHPDWNVAEIQAALIGSSTTISGKKVIQADKALSFKKISISLGLDKLDHVDLNTSDILIPLNTPKSEKLDGALKAEEQKNVFPDVSSDSPNRTAISYLYERDVIKGYEDGTFRPQSEINRAEFLKIVIEAQGTSINEDVFNSCFSDVQKQWFAKYVCYAKELGYIKGYSDNTFKAGQTINKVEAIKILLEVFGEPLRSDTSTTYYDVLPNEWYASYVNTASHLGLIDMGNFLFPGSDMTRGAMAELAFRIMYIRELGFASFSNEV